MGAGDPLESLIVTPTEPPPCAYDFPQPSPGMGDAVAFGADLKPGTLLAAYRSGLFPMPDPVHDARAIVGAIDERCTRARASSIE